MKSKNVLNKVINMCGKDVGERQVHLYERRAERKARVIADYNSHVLLNIMSFFHLVDDFA